MPRHAFVLAAALFAVVQGNTAVHRHPNGTQVIPGRPGDRKPIRIRARPTYGNHARDHAWHLKTQDHPDSPEMPAIARAGLGYKIKGKYEDLPPEHVLNGGEMNIYPYNTWRQSGYWFTPAAILEKAHKIYMAKGLQKAVLMKNPKLVKLLVELGHDVNSRHHEDATPLEEAIVQDTDWDPEYPEPDRYGVIRELLKAKHDVHSAVPAGQNALHFAVAAGAHPIIQDLLDAGFDEVYDKSDALTGVDGKLVEETGSTPEESAAQAIHDHSHIAGDLQEPCKEHHIARPCKDHHIIHKILVVHRFKVEKEAEKKRIEAAKREL